MLLRYGKHFFDIIFPKTMIRYLIKEFFLFVWKKDAILNNLGWDRIQYSLLTYIGILNYSLLIN